MSLKYCVKYDDYPQYRKKDKYRQMISLIVLIILCVALILYFSYLEIVGYSKVYRPELMSTKTVVYNLLCDFIGWKEKLSASFSSFAKMVFDGK
jgi:hypothetical protein